MSSSGPDPITRTINGTPYAISPLNMAGVGRLQKALDRMPYPKDTAAWIARIEAMRAAGTLTDDEVRDHRREAKAEEVTWPPDLLMDPRVLAVFRYDPAGRAAFLAVALSPRPTPEEAAALAESISVPDFSAVYRVAMALGDDTTETAPDPKDEGTTDAPAPGSTTTSDTGGS